MDLTAEHILVTGAAGFIGSHLVDRLLARGARVTGVDNFDPFYPEREKRANLADALGDPRFRLVEADCSHPANIESELQSSSFTAIIHLAARAGVRPSIADPMGYVQANVQATQAMLEFARRRGITRVVFGSSSSVYGEATQVPFTETMPVDAPISPYAATKRACELFCATHAHLHAASIIALRFFTVYGPRQRPDLAIRRFATRMLDGQPIAFHGDGTSSRDYTWIDDIIDGVESALVLTRTQAPGLEIVNLGGSRTTTLRRLVELIETSVGTRARLDHQPDQPGDVSRTFADTSKAHRLLGYAPHVSIDEGIPRFVEWLREHRRRRQTTAGPALDLMASARG